MALPFKTKPRSQPSADLPTPWIVTGVPEKRATQRVAGHLNSCLRLQPLKLLPSDFSGIKNEERLLLCSFPGVWMPNLRMGKGVALVAMDDISAIRAKRASKTKRATSTTVRPPTRMKRLTLDLPESLHRAIKKNAVEDGVTMAEKLRALLTKHFCLTEETP